MISLKAPFYKLFFLILPTQTRIPIFPVEAASGLADVYPSHNPACLEQQADCLGTICCLLVQQTPGKCKETKGTIESTWGVWIVVQFSQASSRPVSHNDEGTGRASHGTACKYWYEAGPPNLSGPVMTFG